MVLMPNTTKTQAGGLDPDLRQNGYGQTHPSGQRLLKVSAVIQLTEARNVSKS